ncbi:MAG: CNNM domain-containing protein, partial [Spirochaetota bacterium]
MTLTIGIFTLLILFLLGAFFSAAETVVTALNSIDISSLKELQEVQGKKIERLLLQKERLIASLLIGNNIANISASAIVAILTNRYLGGFFVFMGTFLLTLFIVFFCEIVPKQFAIIYKKEISFYIFRFILFFYNLFSPVLNVTMWLASKMPLLGKKTEGENWEKSLQHLLALAYE